MNDAETVLKGARRPPAVRLTPYAWAKLVFLRDEGPTEIGGFGISAPGEPLLIEDVQLVRQRCDFASVELDDAAVADYFDEQVDLGRRPEEFGRVWVHTHPGNSPRPSLTDEATFRRVFGTCQWAVMLIVAQGGQWYARLGYAVGPGGGFEIPVEIAFDEAFYGSDQPAWRLEYQACVEPIEPVSARDDFRWLLTDSDAAEAGHWLGEEGLAHQPLEGEAHGHA